MAEEKKESFGSLACDMMEVIATAIVLVLIIFTFFGRLSVVSGQSMEKTLSDRDSLIIENFFYTPKQGDIVVCQSTFFGYDNPIVKRVIATEGQTVRIDSEKWEVYVDDVKLEEDYPNFIEGRKMGGFYNGYGESFTVPEGCIFVMGDNRTNSWDSRDYQVGPIDVRYVVGKAIVRLRPHFRFF